VNATESGNERAIGFSSWAQLEIHHGPCLKGELMVLLAFSVPHRGSTEGRWLWLRQEDHLQRFALFQVLHEHSYFLISSANAQKGTCFVFYQLQLMRLVKRHLAQPLVEQA